MIAQNSTRSRHWTHIAFALVACNMLFALLMGRSAEADADHQALALSKYPALMGQHDRIVDNAPAQITTASLRIER